MNGSIRVRRRRRRTRGGSHAKRGRGSHSEGCSRSLPTEDDPSRAIGGTAGDRQGSTAAGAAGGRGGRPAGSLAGLSTPGAGEAFTPGQPVTLAAEPTELVRLGSGSEPLATVAKAVANKLDWPNRPVPDVDRSAPEPCAAAAVCLRRRDLQGTLRRMPSGGREGKGQGRRESRGFSLCEERRSERRHPGVALGEGRHYRSDATCRRHL